MGPPAQTSASEACPFVLERAAGPASLPLGGGGCQAGAARQGARGAFALVSVCDEGPSPTLTSAHDHTPLPFASPGSCVH